MKGQFTDDTGKGKTSSIIAFAIKSKVHYKNLQIISNVPMFNSEFDKNKFIMNHDDKTVKFFPDFIFSPYMVLNYYQLQNDTPKLVIFDDTKVLKQYLNNLLELASSWSRKCNMTIMVSQQYITMSPLEFRDQTDERYQVNYIKSKDLLEINIIDKDDKVSMYKIYGMKKYQQFYDTDYVVLKPNERRIINEIKRMEIKDLHSLEDNLGIYFSNRKVYERILNKLIQELDIEIKN